MNEKNMRSALTDIENGVFDLEIARDGMSLYMDQVERNLTILQRKDASAVGSFLETYHLTDSLLTMVAVQFRTAIDALVSGIERAYAALSVTQEETCGGSTTSEGIPACIDPKQKEERAESLIALIQSVNIPEAYDMKLGEMKVLHKTYPDVAELMCAAYNYGFINGQRFAGDEGRMIQSRGALEYIDLDALCHSLHCGIQMAMVVREGIEGGARAPAEYADALHGAICYLDTVHKTLDGYVDIIVAARRAEAVQAEEKGDSSEEK